MALKFARKSVFVNEAVREEKKDENSNAGGKRVTQNVLVSEFPPSDSFAVAGRDHRDGNVAAVSRQKPRTVSITTRSAFERAIFIPQVHDVVGSSLLVASTSTLANVECLKRGKQLNRYRLPSGLVLTLIRSDGKHVSLSMVSTKCLK